MKKVDYNKLVRDKIPEIIEATNKRSKIRILSDEEYIIKLNEKLDEELSEYQKNHSVEELVDLVEVIYAILKSKDISLEAFDKLRKEKNQKRGCFDKKILLESVFSEENHE